MSYNGGMAALNLEMPEKIPRTEYSVLSHWKLICSVTGLRVDEASPWPERLEALRAFMRAWDFGLMWNVLIGGGIFGGLKTDMGHAVYEESGKDFNTNIHCPFKTPDDVLAFDPRAAYAAPDITKWAGHYEKHYNDACGFYSDAVNMTGVYVTCMSGLIEIFGWEMLLMAAGEDSEGFGGVTDRYAEFIQPYFDALAASNVPAVMIHDDIVWTEGAFIHPDWYRRYIFPNYKKLFAPLRESGKKILFTSDGNYTEFIDDIAPFVDCFVMEPTTDMRYIAERYGRTHSFVGNADTRILLHGSRDDIRREVRRCMDIGKSCPGFFMAVGNHIPPNTPVENALIYNDAFEEMRRR